MMAPRETFPWCRQRPASFSASAKSGFFSIERSFTFSLPRHGISSTQSAPFNASVETCWNRKPWRFPRDFHVKKNFGFPVSSFKPLNYMIWLLNKWIYHMGISWEYPGCEDAAGSRPSKKKKKTWGF